MVASSVEINGSTGFEVTGEIINSVSDNLLSDLGFLFGVIELVPPSTKLFYINHMVFRKFYVCLRFFFVFLCT